MPEFSYAVGERRKYILALVLSAGAFGFLADLPQLPVAALLLGLVATFRQPWLEPSAGSVIYSALTAIVLTALGELFLPYENRRLGIFNMLFQVRYTAPFLYYGVLLGMNFRRERVWKFGTAIAAIFTLCAIGDVFNFSNPSARLYWPGEMFRDIYPVFYLLFAALLIFLLLSGGGKSTREKWLSGFLLTVLLPLLWYGTWHLHHQYERKIRQWENRLTLQKSQRWNPRSDQKIKFSEKVDLRLPVPRVSQEMESRIVLYATGKNPPGYLRARAFNTYMQGGWTEETTEELPPEILSNQVPGLDTFRHRRTGEEASTAARHEIFWREFFQPKELPIPGNWNSIELIGEAVNCSREGEVTSPGWISAGGMKVGSADASGEGAFPLPRKPGTRYLQIPEELRSILAQEEQKLKLAPNADFSSKLVAMTHYFGKFRYELGGAGFRRDPITEFLQTRKAGHCELFASAAAMLARQLQLPSRYVTGILCSERHPSGKYFVARAGNLHAWTELFDPERQRWVLFDPTPPDARPDYTGNWNFLNANSDRFFHFWQNLLAALRRGEAARIGRLLLSSPWFYLALVAIAGILLEMKFFLQPQGKYDPLPPSGKNAKRWRKHYLRWMKQQQKKGKFSPLDSRTAEELLRLIDASPAYNAEEKAQAHAFLADYESGRFGDFSSENRLKAVDE